MYNTRGYTQKNPEDKTKCQDNFIIQKHCHKIIYSDISIF